jgi:hypothetical protein
LDGWRGIGQSKPWDEEGRWSHVQINRKEPFLEYQKEDWDRREKNTKSRALLGDQKEGMDEWHGMWQRDPVWLGVGENGSGKDTQEGANQGTEVLQPLLSLQREPWLGFGCGILSVP